MTGRDNVASRLEKTRTAIAQLSTRFGLKIKSLVMKLIILFWTQNPTLYRTQVPPPDVVRGSALPSTWTIRCPRYCRNAYCSSSRWARKGQDDGTPLAMGKYCRRDRA